MTNSDILLIHLIKKGDIKAFEQLFRHYYLPLCRYAQCIVGTREAAEEIASKTGSEVVHVIGSRFVLYKRNPKDPVIDLKD